MTKLEQECRGFIEIIDSDTPPTGKVYYIPHRPVKSEKGFIDRAHPDSLRLQQPNIIQTYLV